MSEVHADDIMQVIREKGWWQRTDADYIPRGRACLAMALECAATLNTSDWDRWDAVLKQAVNALFPDRASYGNKVPCYSYYIRFNDHPDTTLADVELVVKEAEARL